MIDPVCHNETFSLSGRHKARSNDSFDAQAASLWRRAIPVPHTLQKIKLRQHRHFTELYNHPVRQQQPPVIFGSSKHTIETDGDHYD